MKFYSRIELRLTCGSKGYFLAGGEDCRNSLSTMLKIARDIVTAEFYCGTAPGPEILWYADDFLRDLKEKHDGLPCEVSAIVCFSYLEIATQEGDDFEFAPASTLLKAFLPEFKAALLRFGIDPRAWQVDVKQWDVDCSPDDSDSHDFIDGDEICDDTELKEEIPSV